ncbi:MAG: MATE family efflux transporter [Clostridia bacterium]|nr:MATE family efflux transporter [Clostridia bacterium]
MEIKLSDHFTYRKLVKFCIPPIIMMVFTSIYSVVDGFFVSNFAGQTAFNAVNLIFPFIMILGGVGFMIGTGGTALIGKTLGEGKPEKANQYFSMIVTLTFVVGSILTVIGIICARPVAQLLGAEGETLEECVIYGRIVLSFIICFMLQNVFQVILPLAERQKLGLYFNLAGGITNIILDALFVGVFRWGIIGAAFATGISETIAGLLPIIYFLSKRNTSLLHLTKTKFEIKPMLRACGNGISELFSNISGSIVSIVYNWQLLRYAGANGVSAYGVLMYVQFIFIAIFIGYTIGSSPVISYHYGAENHAELKGLLKKSLVLNLLVGVIMMVLAFSLSSFFAQIYVGYKPELLSMTAHAFRIIAVNFFIIGVNIFISSFFTALNNGIISAIISVMRTLGFKLLAAILLPLWFGVEGIWWSITFAETMALIISVSFLLAKKHKYHY